ncbi:hypothetical protein SC09_contig4orf00221 [Bacillus subtilis]|uniref:Uncharacterized protein n=1 Tax=Bacillus subtilis TaxID=1423 RepID=A0A0D1IZJ6_BACIU|nr:hypothetical protein SC09_contig4orf00221 [Bacillus subtilis]
MFVLIMPVKSLVAVRHMNGFGLILRLIPDILGIIQSCATRIKVRSAGRG